MEKLDPKEIEKKLKDIKAFYKKVTGKEHIGITVFANTEFPDMPNDRLKSLAANIVDAAQARTPKGATMKTMKGMLVVDAMVIHFCTFVDLQAGRSIVYFSNSESDADEINKVMKKTMLGGGKK